MEMEMETLLTQPKCYKLPHSMKDRTLFTPFFH